MKKINTKKQIHKVGEQLGFISSFFISSILLYFSINFIHPFSSWSFALATIIVGSIAITGLWIKKILT